LINNKLSIAAHYSGALQANPPGRGLSCFYAKIQKAHPPGQGMKRITGYWVFPNGGAGLAAWIYLQAQYKPVEGRKQPRTRKITLRACRACLWAFIAQWRAYFSLAY